MSLTHVTHEFFSEREREREREFIYSDEKPRIVNNDYAEDISPTDEIKQRATTAISIVVVRNALGSESTNSHETRWPATRRRCGERTAVALTVTRERESLFLYPKKNHGSSTFVISGTNRQFADGRE